MSSSKTQTYAVLPLRDIVIFPKMIVPLAVGRERSIRALEEVMSQSRRLLFVTQKQAEQVEPSAEDLYSVGTVGNILQLLKLPDGTVKILIEGDQRVRIKNLENQGDYFTAEVSPLPEDLEDPTEAEALMRTVLGQFEQYVKLYKKIPPELIASINQIEDPARLSDTIAAHLNLKIDEKQRLLEKTNVLERLEAVFTHMENEIGMLQLEKKIRGRVRKQMEKSQRDYYLNEQMKAIQKELGDFDETKNDIKELEEKIQQAKMSKEAKTKAEKELRKLKQMSPMSAEATVVRNYLDWLVDIPWSAKSRIKKNLIQAEKILNSDHYGLEKVKERILEYLAVQQRTNRINGPILCLVGPPGVGKTSLGESIARAIGRKFVRISLGGVRDEAEIRGHRRTYIGSMPGKIVQSMKKAGTVNPLILLDEIDKLGSDWRGDPSAALLEVLDPAQNKSFMDHYLEAEYDLSNVMFITTANTLDMPRPLLDRMEVIRIPGYTETEKVEISKNHLIPRQMKENGLKKGEWSITDAGLRDLIRYYTREAGVRNLEREIARLTRRATKEILEQEALHRKDGKKGKPDVSIKVAPSKLEKYAGVRKYRYGRIEEEDLVGVATGLAWTETGGDLLQIEAVMVPGKGKMTTTGNLKDVMKESIQAAQSFVRAKAAEFGIVPTIFEKRDIHVHVPEGATPKDGPSAGITMCTSIVSVLTGIPVRNDVAMTGEITLRGRVLPIGGLKEKLLAALRGGIKTVLIPKDNEKDLKEIPDNILEELEIIPVSSATEVLSLALTKPLLSIEWQEDGADDLLHSPVANADRDGEAVTAH